MKKLIIAAGLCLCWAIPAAAADQMEDTFDKVNRHLYGVTPDEPQQAEPVREEASPEPAAEQWPMSPPPSRAERNITWDFETGDLTGWSATGDAFRYQPTYGDNPTARHRGQPSNHRGDFWIGTYENCPSHRHHAGQTQGDGPRGTLTSAPFTVQANSISFLVGGGCDLETERVELVIDGRVVDRVTGKCTETMARDSFPVAKYRGRSAQIRLVDESSSGWGHINFDDARFE